MSAFANLMALSASQTAEQQSAVELAIRERQRKEAERRKAQEAREAKERELEKQRRLKLFEEQKKEEERKKREAELEKARELALKRKEEEQRDRLLYGPKKAAKMASASHGSGARGGSDGKSKSSFDEDDGPIPLTREELRERKQRMEMMRMYGGSKRGSSSHHGGTHRVGRRLPGGAVDITSPSPQASQSSGDGLSVRERLAAMPNTLVKLNTVKRDTRTIDEILQDRAKEKKKVLEGDQAAQFDDWFGSKKKEDKSRPSSVGPGSGADTPQRPSASSTSVQKKVATVPSKPALTAKTSALSKPVPSSSQSRGSTSKLPDFSKSKPSGSTPKPNGKTSSYDYDRGHSRERDRERERDRDRDRSYPSSSSKQRDVSRKRPRSDSRSMSPVPYSSKKRSRSMVDDDDPTDVRAEIWKLFGKDRDRYVGQDVCSDDEDMEADVLDVEKEEMKSARLAQKEDRLALEEERRREEEKKRRKKMMAKAGRD